VNLPHPGRQDGVQLGYTAVVTNPPSTGKTLVPYHCRALFSQVNSDLDDIFLDRAASTLHAETAFHDRMEVLPDPCPTNDRFRYPEAITTTPWQSRILRLKPRFLISMASAWLHR
jgi:hypothetical protein